MCVCTWAGRYELPQSEEQRQSGWDIQQLLCFWQAAILPLSYWRDDWTQQCSLRCPGSGGIHGMWYCTGCPHSQSCSCRYLGMMTRLASWQQKMNLSCSACSRRRGPRTCHCGPGWAAGCTRFLRACMHVCVHMQVLLSKKINKETKKKVCKLKEVQNSANTRAMQTLHLSRHRVQF
jgi:hypothetical protein